MVVALNCSPCSRSLTHQPSALSHSPAVTEGSDPTTVGSCRAAFAFVSRTRNPPSSLWTRWTMPEICLVGGRALREWRSQSCRQHTQRSYSDHDTQECSVAGFDRDDSDDGSFAVDVRLHLPQCLAERGSFGHAVLVLYLCVWLLQRHGVLLRVPQNAEVVIWARAWRAPDRVRPPRNSTQACLRYGDLRSGTSESHGLPSEHRDPLF